MGMDKAMVFMQGCDSCSTQNDNETHIYYETCEGQKSISVSTACQQDDNLGRVLDVTATLHNVCPGRCSAVGLTLTEVDGNGQEYARGFRAVSVPAHSGCRNQDIELDSIRFVMPEENALQRRRHFILRTDHHYTDSSWS